MLPNMPLTIVFPNKLTAAVVARVWPEGLVRVHVSYVLRVAYEGAFAEMALEGLSRAAHVGPSVQFQVPLRRERLVADYARIGFLATVR